MRRDRAKTSPSRPLVSYHFGAFELDQSSLELRLDGRSTGLPPKPASILLYLIQNRDRVVTKGELLDALWPDTFVSDSALTSAVKHLRRILRQQGDDGLVETHRGRGYRFTGQVSEKARRGPVAASTDDSIPGRTAPREDSGSTGPRRRLITVLMAELRAESQAAEPRDPEDWGRLVGGFRELVGRAVEPLGGRLARTPGPRVLAVFAWGQEDHATRACQAALALADRSGRFEREASERYRGRFVVQVALSTGEATVGGEGAESSPEHVRGRALSVAARLLELKLPGPLLGPETASRVADYMRVEQLAPEATADTPLGGAAYALLGAGPTDTRLEAARRRGLSPFVGRGRELAQLLGALEEATMGRGHAVVVVGQAGIGKSRLCMEFCSRCEQRGLAVYRTHCPPFGPSVPLMGFVQLLRSHFDLLPTDDATTCRAVLRRRLVGWDPALEADLPAILELIGPDSTASGATDPAGPHMHIAELMRRLVQARSRAEPAVLLVDDAHWLDATSRALVSDLVDAVRQTKTLLLINARPGEEEAVAGGPDWDRMTLRPLRDGDVAELATKLLGPDPTLLPLKQTVLDQARGNPLFLEELVAGLVDSGQLEGGPGDYRRVGPSNAIELPGSLDDLLSARIEGLSGLERRVLEAAAVLGRRFSVSALESMVGTPRVQLRGALASLRRQDLLRTHYEAPAAEWGFAHPLFLEATYRALTRARRRALHKRALRALSAQYARTLDEKSALLAHHAEASNQAEAAALWHERAALWAAGKDLAAALSHWGRVRDLADGLPVSDRTRELGFSARLHILDYAWRTGATEAQAGQLMENDLRWAEQSGPEPRAYLAQVQSSLWLYLLADIPRARERCLEGLEFARERGQAAELLTAQIRLVYTHIWAGDFVEALSVHAEALEHPPEVLLGASRLVGYDVEAALPALAAGPLIPMGQVARAESACRAGLRLAEARADAEVTSYALSSLCTVCCLRGDLDEATAVADRLGALADTLGSELARSIALMAKSQTLAAGGRWPDVCETIEENLTLCRRARVNRILEPMLTAQLADALLFSGRPNEAVGTAREALGLATTLQTKAYQVDAQAALAQALYVVHGPGIADRLDEGLTVAETLAARLAYGLAVPRLRALRARLALDRGDREASERLLDDVEARCQRMNAPAMTAGLRSGLQL